MLNNDNGVGKAGLIAFAAAAGAGLWKMLEERISSTQKLDDIVEHLENIESKLDSKDKEDDKNDS